MCDIPSNYSLPFRKFEKSASVRFKLLQKDTSVVYKLLLRHDLKHNLISFDPVVALTFGIGT